MLHLLDTCVLSEPAQRRPEAKVIRFLNELHPAGAFISVLTLGEIHHGIERLPTSARRRDLLRWFETDLRNAFRGRILSVDEEVSLRWSRMRAVLEARGRVLPTIDSLIAATALVHGMRLVTRNEADFDGTGVDVVNPWR